MNALGLDIGGGSVKGAMRQSRSGEWRTAVSPRYDSGDPDRVRGAIHEVLDALGEEAGSCTSLGLCLPGVLDATGERVAYAANMPGLIGAEICELLPETVRGVPRRVAPDSLATGVGAWHGEPVGGRLLVLAMGTGVGACLLEDGRPVTLDGRGCGHVGQIDVSLDDHAPIGPDGGRGSLEAYAGLPALRARLGDDLQTALATLTPDDPALRALARALRIAHAVYTPDHVRLAGGVGAMLAPALPVLRELVARDLTLVARERWSLACIDDLHLGAKGAAELGAQGVPS